MDWTPARLLNRFIALLCFAAIGPLAHAAPQQEPQQPPPQPQPRHGLAMHGEPKYPAGFTHFEYANPKAPKGGTLRLAAVGSSGFDSLNPFVIKGVPAAGLQQLEAGYLYETLTVHSDDEALSIYGLVADSLIVPDNRNWVIFHINPKARFHDGHPITAEDVIFTFDTLTEKGHPLYKSYYGNVAKVEALDPLTVKFSFKPGDNRELPLIVGDMPILPKHFWQGRDFGKANLDVPLGSGPYRIKSIDPGRSITYERVKDYWAVDLPVNRGRYNFDTIRIDYYRDANVAIEALKSGEFDFRSENTAKLWATAYTGPQFNSGAIVKEEIAHQLSTGMQAFVYNTRRWQFQDRKVRQALAYALDFEWTNKQLFHGAYSRTRSYFSNSELASSGLPGPAELKILEPYRDRLPPEVFTKEYAPPTTEGGSIRDNLRTAMKLLREAGWSVKDGKLIHNETGRPLTFEFLLAVPDYERLVQPFRRNLERLGVVTTIRTVDVQQYVERLNHFDFDMVFEVLPQSLSPGNEQRDYWNSSEADRPGSRNYIGIKNPVIDELIELVISAPDREALINRTRALDRVLLWGHYVIPNWYYQYFRVAYWDKFERPPISPKYALGIDTWWAK